MTTVHEETVSSRTAFEGRLLRLEVQEVVNARGVRARREIVRHPGAVAVLAATPDGTLVLVRQFRKPVERVMLEVVAGLREPGESAEACARREVLEETGCKVLRLEAAGAVYPSPGYVDERIDVFFARVEPEHQAPCPDEDEDLEVVLLSRDAFERQLARGDVLDGKTLAAWALCAGKVRHD